VKGYRDHRKNWCGISTFINIQSILRSKTNCQAAENKDCQMLSLYYSMVQCYGQTGMEGKINALKCGPNRTYHVKEKLTNKTKLKNLKVTQELLKVVRIR
jgi:hypothetical protein